MPPRPPPPSPASTSSSATRSTGRTWRRTSPRRGRSPELFPPRCRCPVDARDRSGYYQGARTDSPHRHPENTMDRTSLATYAARLDLDTREAAAHAAAAGLVIGKHTDPTEGAREGLSADEAADIAAEDVSLIYVVEVAADVTIADVTGLTSLLAYVEECDDDTDLTSLPVFGGAEPRDTRLIYSWDETHLLVHSGHGRQIVAPADGARPPRPAPLRGGRPYGGRKTPHLQPEKPSLSSGPRPHRKHPRRGRAPGRV